MAHIFSMTAYSKHMFWCALNHPSCCWQCSVSDCLHLRVGGDFTYSPQPGSTASNLFLVAGGVGINPLLAMLKHHMELWSADHWNNTLPAIPKVCLLYSAREEGELLFKVHPSCALLTCKRLWFLYASDFSTTLISVPLSFSFHHNIPTFSLIRPARLVPW